MFTKVPSFMLIWVLAMVFVLGPVTQQLAHPLVVMLEEIQIIVVELALQQQLVLLPSTAVGLAGEAAAFLAVAALKLAPVTIQLLLTVEQLAVNLLLSPAILSFALTILAPPILVTQQAVGIM